MTESTERIEVSPGHEIAPEKPPTGPVVWIKENLFPSPGSSVLTIVMTVIILAFFRGLLSFVVDPLRRWEAVTENMRLLMVQAYPVEQFLRVWLSVGFVFGLLALSLAAWRMGGRMSPAHLTRILMSVGGLILLFGLIGPWGAMARVAWLAVGLALTLGPYAWRRSLGESAKQETLPVLGVIAAGLLLLLIAMWVVPVPRATVEGPRVFRRVATTTTIPWTVIFFVSVGLYFVGKRLRDAWDEGALRKVLTIAWVASFPLVYLVILRDPAFDYNQIGTFLIPAALLAAVGGGLFLSFLGKPGIGERGRAVAAVIGIATIGTFLVPMSFFVRFVFLSLTAFALAAPSFGGDAAARRRYVFAWVGWVAIMTYLFALTTTESTVDVPGSFYIGGLALTFLIAISAITLSFPLGVVLALGRTSTMPIFRLMSTAYIELVRGVPLITWLLVAFIMLPVALPPGVTLNGVIRAIVMIAFFSGAYLAENVRGGLQSIPKGQYEAAKALGMTTAQMTVLITLPQALRAVIPALVGQVIALFKDTSLVTIVGLFDFLHIARQVIPTQTQPFNFLGSIKETLLFAAIVYWVFTFTMSRVSQRLERKLGVGER